MSNDFADLDATALAELIQRGEASAAELVDAAIRRLEDRNDALNAVVHLDLDGAAERARTDELAGPFAGVPFLTKDLACREAGRPFHEGNRHLKEIGYVSPYDQVLARRFRASGLVSLGRTNVPEFGMRPVCEPLAYGPTNNPWNLAHSPGGSTGGGATAVAAGIVPIAHANDVGGSIRAPASHCGLVGLKPTRGRSTMAPDFFDVMGGLNEDLVVTRSVRDTALALDTFTSKPETGDWYPTWDAADSYVAESGSRRRMHRSRRTPMSRRRSGTSRPRSARSGTTSRSHGHRRSTRTCRPSPSPTTRRVPPGSSTTTGRGCSAIPSPRTLSNR